MDRKLPFIQSLLFSSFVFICVNSWFCFLLILTFVVSSQALRAETAVGKNPKAEAAAAPPFEKRDYKDVMRGKNPESPDGGKKTPPGTSVEEQGKKYEDLRLHSLKTKKLYPQEFAEELLEGKYRRFEVVFLISLPFSGLLGYILLQSANLAITRNNYQKLAFSHRAFIGINAVILSAYIAYRDMRTWEAYKLKHLRDLQFAPPAPGLSFAVEPDSPVSRKREFAYYCSLGKYSF